MDVFFDIPTEALIPPSDFAFARYRIPYQAAYTIRMVRKQPWVGKKAVDDFIAETPSAQKAIRDELNGADWRLWSDDLDFSIATHPKQPEESTYCLHKIHDYAVERTKEDIKKRIAAGEWDDGFLKAFHGTNGTSPVEAKGASIFDYQDRIPSSEDCLLGNRFLCRKGGMLFVGPSGSGKSSASVQQDIEWCLGRLSFGIKPSGSLTIVTIQAEDDDGDLHEMVTGVCKKLGITKKEKEEHRNKCIYVSHKTSTGKDFIKFVRSVLRKYRPDILRINPLQAYIGGDIKSQEVTSAFLREGLNPLLEEFNCACIIVHHTPKTNFRDTDEWRASDWMYAGAGAADITNWARAILIENSTDDPNVFEFIAAKRGKRIGWADDNGVPIITRHFSHSEEGGIHWNDTEEERIPEKKKRGAKKKFDESVILDNMSMTEGRKVSAIFKLTADSHGIGKTVFYELWEKLKNDGKVVQGNNGWTRLI